MYGKSAKFGFNIGQKKELGKYSKTKFMPHLHFVEVFGQESCKIYGFLKRFLPQLKTFLNKDGPTVENLLKTGP